MYPNKLVSPFTSKSRGESMGYNDRTNTAASLRSMSLDASRKTGIFSRTE